MEPLLTLRKTSRQCSGESVYSVPGELPAEDRARWLAQLAETLDEARALVAQLQSIDDRGSPAQELYLSIEATRR